MMVPPPIRWLLGALPGALFRPRTVRLERRHLGGLLLVLALGWPTAASAQAHRALAAHEPALLDSVRALGVGFEAAWNALLVAHLRAQPDSVPGEVLARAARAESLTLGTRVASDALRRLTIWTPQQRLERVRAAEAESIGFAAERMRDFAVAESHYRLAIDGYEFTGDLRREATVRGRLAACATQANDFERAESLVREALATRRRLGDPRLIGNSLYDLGQILALLHRPHEARQFLEEARIVRIGTGQMPQLGSTLLWLGAVLEDIGHRDSAEALTREALTFTSGAGDSARTAEVLVQLVRLVALRGGNADALIARTRPLVAGKHADSPFRLNVGDYHYRSGRYHAAISELEAALVLAREMGDPRAEGNVLNLLALARIHEAGSNPDRRDFRPARRNLARAAAVADSMGDHDLAARAHNNLAVCAIAENRLADAHAEALRALRAAGRLADSLPRLREAQVTLGDVAMRRGKHAVAEDWLRRAAALGPAHGIREHAGATLMLGWAMLFQGRLVHADSLFDEVARGAENAGLVDLSWRALHGRGEVAEREGRDLDALKHYRRAATVIDTVRSRQALELGAVTTFAGRLAGFEGLIHLLGRLQPHHPDSTFTAEAFQWAERARARALKDLRIANSLAPVDEVAPTLEAVAERIGPDEALLYYSVGDSSSSLWVVRAKHWRHFLLPARAALTRQVHQLATGLDSATTADSRATMEASRRLYAMLVRPALGMLEGVRRLRIAPDGPLARLPFEALRTPETVGARYHYVVERWTVSYVSSAGAMLEPLDRLAGNGIFAVADPSFGRLPGAARLAGSRRLAPLPDSRREVDVLRRLAGSAPYRVLMGSEATRDRILDSRGLEEARIAHVSTHGDASREDAEASGLWLAADSSGVSTRLTVRDILELRSRAELVTLSACETGLGRLERGEGVLGLTRAFLAGGSRSVTVSLWSVSSRWTAVLMQRFYQQLLENGVRRDEALAEAKRHILRETTATSPYYWAAFVLVGDPGQLPR
jgi:CHAT domain-containing protein